MMKELVFIETIKVLNGKFYNIELHIERMHITLNHFGGNLFDLSLNEADIPDNFRTGMVKCRIIYSLTDFSISYEQYRFRNIQSLKLVNDDSINYTYKYADRSELNNLLSEKGCTDDILIVKNSCITDTSYSNVVFENKSGLYTPSSYLLNGTKRQQLLKQGLVKETEIKVEDLKQYDKLYFINAMIDLEDNIAVPIANIIL